MKLFLATICCFSVVVIAHAADDNRHKRKEAEQAQQAPPAQQVVKPGKHATGTQLHGGAQLNSNAQLNNATLANKHPHHLKAQDNALPATQANGQLNSKAKLAGKGQKFEVKKFQTKNGPDPAIASVKFKENHHIEGSEKWQGKQYAAFKAYKSERHEREWWEHHHNRIILIGGGWYYWDAGFWYPAWGYDTIHVYYPYDGPIYAYNDLPPDQVIANVQAALQSQGYYQGQVDGLLGPLTRAALAQYQADHGLYTTAAIDQPTLAALGMV